uniref:F14M2.1 protein n=1 Tax=Arabidopsis thaliana TaxID=3702 RepID=Q9LQ37_ARATH|nr:Hypothetical protein [Arabidopsis thaliana]
MWRLYDNKEWKFIVDEKNRRRLLFLELTTTFEELKLMVREDYGIERSTNDVELSYLSTDLSVDCLPVVMMNNRQVSNFLSYCKKKNTVKLCVTFNGGVEDKGGKEKFDLNKEPDAPSDGDAYFKADKKVLEKNKFCRTPSTKTIGRLIMHNYEGVLEGPKPNDISNIIRTQYGHELTYHQVWEAHEYTVNEVRGIPEKSYGKILKYLYMLEQANPGTFTNYEFDGFYKPIRKVIVVDGKRIESEESSVLDLESSRKFYRVRGIVDQGLESSSQIYWVQRIHGRTAEWSRNSRSGQPYGRRILELDGHVIDESWNRTVGWSTNPRTERPDDRGKKKVLNNFRKESAMFCDRNS